MRTPKPLPLILLLLCLPAREAIAQKKTDPPLLCKPTVFAARKELPKLEYDCPDQIAGYDEKILKLPERLEAIDELKQTLATLADAGWWRANVDDLNLCDCRGKPGRFTPEESEKFRQGDYVMRLFGNHQIRMVLIDDPCFQPGYQGSNAFLLYYDAGKVVVSQVLNGYSSRADNSVSLDFANLNGQQIVEIATGTGGLVPYLTNYYFVIDPKTRQAKPFNIFRDHGKPTNEVTSVMLFGEMKDYGLPQSASPLYIVRGHRIAASFSLYDDGSGSIDDNGRMVGRKIYRWNGRFYSPARPGRH